MPHPAELRDVSVAEGKTRFLDLPLHQEVQFGVQHAGFEYCTPIQALTLPAVLAGRDIAGKAQTGTEWQKAQPYRCNSRRILIFPKGGNINVYP